MANRLPGRPAGALSAPSRRSPPSRSDEGRAARLRAARRPRRARVRPSVTRDPVTAPIRRRPGARPQRLRVGDLSARSSAPIPEPGVRLVHRGSPRRRGPCRGRRDRDPKKPATVPAVAALGLLLGARLMDQLQSGVSLAALRAITCGAPAATVRSSPHACWPRRRWSALGGRRTALTLLTAARESSDGARTTRCGSPGTGGVPPSLRRATGARGDRRLGLPPRPAGVRPRHASSERPRARRLDGDPHELVRAPGAPRGVRPERGGAPGANRSVTRSDPRERVASESCARRARERDHGEARCRRGGRRGHRRAAPRLARRAGRGDRNPGRGRRDAGRRWGAGRPSAR